MEQARRDGVHVPAENIFQVQYSGVDLFKIPELNLLWQRLEADDSPKILYCWVQDRMIRGTRRTDIFYISTRCRVANTKLFLVKKQIELTEATVGQDVEVLIDGHKAHSEIEDIIDRTWTRGRLRRMKEGKIPNSGPEKFGWRRVRQTGKAVIVPEEAALVQRAAEEIEQGWGFSTIAQRLNREGIPSPSKKRWFALTISRFFTDPAYKGEGYGWKWSRKKSEGVVRSRPKETWVKLAADAYPPIVEPARWDRINKLIQENKGIKARQERVFVLLRGLVRCAGCDYPAFFTRCKDRQGNLAYGYYACGRNGKECREFQKRSCHARRRNAKELDQQIWELAIAHLRQPDLIREILQGEAAEKTESFAFELVSLEKSEQSKRAEIERLAGRLRTAPDAIAEHIEQEMLTVEAERRGIQSRIANLRQRQLEQEGKEASLRSVLDLATTLAEDLTDPPIGIKRKILEALPIRWTLEGGIWVCP